MFYLYKKNKEIRNEVREELVLSLNTVYNAYAKKSFKDLDEIISDISQTEPNFAETLVKFEKLIADEEITRQNIRLKALVWPLNL